MRREYIAGVFGPSLLDIRLYFKNPHASIVSIAGAGT